MAYHFAIGWGLFPAVTFAQTLPALGGSVNPLMRASPGAQSCYFAFSRRA